jgi:anti-sigma factor ChrR (cupin superfamily)
MDTASMAWQPSPSGSVWRKRVHLVGEPESGQVTSMVRYEAGSHFPAHDHPEGEEILVVAGTFQDEHGDWPAGTYLLNPEGFRHAPFSDEGCELFVKLRQFGGSGREHVAIQTNQLTWKPSHAADIDCKELYCGPRRDPDGPVEAMRLERWHAGASHGERSYAGGVEILVLRGIFEDEFGRYGEGTWLRLPVAGAHRPFSQQGCELYVKSGAVASLRSR